MVDCNSTKKEAIIHITTKKSAQTFAAQGIISTAGYEKYKASLAY